MSRSDPIRTNYFDAVQRADTVTDWLFYLSALLSFCTLLVEQKTHPDAYGVVLTLFSISVVAMFALGMMLRLYLTPRAEDKRRQDFYSSACVGADPILTHPADSILTRGWMPTAWRPAVDKCRLMAVSLTS